MAKALGDDLDAGFGELFGAYQGLVFSAALRLSGCRANAEELTTEAFLRAYRTLCDYEPGRIAELRPRPWLMTILLTLWQSGSRTAARWPSPPPAGGSGGTRRGLAELLRLLPCQQQAALVLRHVVGMPVPEIAAVFDAPEGAVESHISQGLWQLRTLASAGGTR